MVRTLVGTMLERGPERSRSCSRAGRGSRPARRRRPGGCISIGVATEAPDAAGHVRYDRPVRYPVVLFDLDGTVVDSGRIILASMRHATRHRARARIPDEELMAPRRRAGPRGADAGARPGPRRRARAASTARTTSRCTRRSRRSRAWRRARRRSKARATSSGIVTAKRRVDRRARVRAPAALGHLFDVRRRRRRDRAAQAATRIRCCSRSSALGADAERGGLRRRLAVRHAGREGRGHVRGRRHAGAGSTAASAARATPTSSSTRRRSCLPLL